MGKLRNWVKKELTLKFDLVNNEFEIGWIWVIVFAPQVYVGAKTLVIDIINLLS